MMLLGALLELLTVVLLSLRVNASSVSGETTAWGEEWGFIVHAWHCVVVVFFFAEFQFDVVPSSVVAFIGERVEYRCVAPCAGIFWIINDTIAGADHNIVVSTWTRPRNDREPGEESTLWITASAYANNSAIKCCVENRRIGLETHSSQAYLTVQGMPHCMCTSCNILNHYAIHTTNQRSSLSQFCTLHNYYPLDFACAKSYCTQNRQ